MTDAVAAKNPPDGSGAGSVSVRVVAARAVVRQRQDAQRTKLYPLRLLVLAVVVVPAIFAATPAGLHGRGLAITIWLVVYALAMLVAPHGRGGTSPIALQLVDLYLIGGAGIALAVLQPQAASELPASAAVLMAAIGLPVPFAAAVGVPVTVALVVALGSSSGAQAAVGSVLLCVVLGVLGTVVRQTRMGQDPTEVLLAELEDARDDQARAAGLAERSRIARELHDVLAHSLSGLSIQLEGARRLARNDGASTDLQGVIDRSATLAKEGLVEARQAVDALRSGDLTTVERLPDLVDHYRNDLDLPVELVVDGAWRSVPIEVSLMLYQVTREALTNVVRHAPGAVTKVALRFAPGEIGLKVADRGTPATPPDAAGSPAGSSAEREPHAGGGWGLVGIRERVVRVGGLCTTGPEGTGWVVDVVVPT